MKQLTCQACAANYPFDDPRWRCGCGHVLDLQLESVFQPDRIVSDKLSMWRYRQMLPIVEDDHVVSFDEGLTPLMETWIGDNKIWIKQEHLFPTGSYKDRGASLLVSRAVELGIHRVVEDSSGNAGAAIAAYTALAGIECEIFVPEGTSPAKLAQIECYGAAVREIPGSREDTARAVLEAAETDFYASHSWSPFFFHGTKTYAYEIWEQLGFEAPDVLIVPTGNGTLLIGAFLGFQDLLSRTLISKLPRMIAVQSEQCAPLYRMWADRLEDLPRIEPGKTVAEGIAIAEPIRGRQIVDLVRRTRGAFVTVSEREIEACLVEMGRKGWVMEPTSASAFAGLKKCRIDPRETVVVPITGHGLKSTEKLMRLL